MFNGNNNLTATLALLAVLAAGAALAMGILPDTVADVVRVLLIALFVAFALTMAGIVAYLVWASKQHEAAEMDKYSGMDVEKLSEDADGEIEAATSEWRERQRRKPVGKHGGPTMRSSSQEEIAGTRYGMSGKADSARTDAPDGNVR